MANERNDEVAGHAVQASERRESGGTSGRTGGARAPADVTTPGSHEHAGRTPERQAGSDVSASPRPGAGPNAQGDEPDSSPERSASAERSPESLGEGSESPVLYGEDPGVIGQ